MLRFLPKGLLKRSFESRIFMIFEDLKKRTRLFDFLRVRKEDVYEKLQRRISCVRIVLLLGVNV